MMNTGFYQMVFLLLHLESNYIDCFPNVKSTLPSRSNHSLVIITFSFYLLRNFGSLFLSEIGLYFVFSYCPCQVLVDL